jgi:hypothetical protein
VAGREPPSEQRSERQPGYLGESLVHLHLHRAPISATQPAYGYPGHAQPGYGYQGYSGNPAYSAPPGYGYPGYTGQPAYPSAGYGSPSNSGYPAYSGPPASAPPSDSGRQLTQVVRAMDIRARRPILRTPVPEIRSLAIPAIALRRTGRLGPSTRSSLLAEFRRDTKSSPRCAARCNDRCFRSALHDINSRAGGL